MYLAGYLDAVGRELTNDLELVCLSSNYIASSDFTEEILGSPILHRDPITKWSSEFGSLIEGQFGISERSRLGFYLIDYIDWFRQFTDNAQCFKITCESQSPGALFEAIYLLQWSSGQKVALSFSRFQKAQPE